MMLVVSVSRIVSLVVPYRVALNKWLISTKDQMSILIRKLSHFDKSSSLS